MNPANDHSLTPQPPLPQGERGSKTFRLPPLPSVGEGGWGGEGERVETVARAILYEGYLLYPYRPSSVKNRQRWSFGGVHPRAYSEAQTGADNWLMQTDCLVAGSEKVCVVIRVGFLHLLERQVGQLTPPLEQWPEAGEPVFHLVPTLPIGEHNWTAWQEATERQLVTEEVRLADLLDQPRILPLEFSASRQLTPLSAGAKIVGVIVRQQEEIKGEIGLSARVVEDGLFCLRVQIRNHTPLPEGTVGDREIALRHTLISTHTILQAREGEFVSLLDPPPQWKPHADQCSNVGTWPVLAGEQGSRSFVLSSPIILYDYPQVAPESPGDLFDATEIDEILTLRILTLTDEEKNEMAGADDRARRLLQRTEGLVQEQLRGLHGTLRSPSGPVEDSGRDNSTAEARTWTEERPGPEYARDDGVLFKPGDRVRLQPSRRADVFDLALAGKVAVIESIEQDFEGRFFFTVSVDDDPGQDFAARGTPGHRFFFSPDEVVKLD